MKKILILLLMMGCCMASKAQHRFTLSKNDFLLDGKPFQVISGELHPARIPKQYWRHRIRMAKAMGCNTIAAYVFWNYQETTKGKFDYVSENRNIAEFIRTCQEEKMWVLLRPGPYVCAEWDFGGLPVYLLQHPDIKIRCMDPRYMAAVETYITSLAQQVRSLQCSKGGPILMLQIENEYGSYGNDKNYLEALRKLWLKNGIDIPFYTADGATAYMLEAGHLKGTAIGLDSGGSDADFEAAKNADPEAPAFSSETYPGWLTHWGEQWARPDSNEFKKEVAYLLKNKKSVNFYVVHGGTNFGFTAGANASTATQYQPDLTSYDYDAPIDEQGNPTPKFFMLRNMISESLGTKLLPLPAPVPTMEIPPVAMQYMTSIWNRLPPPVSSVQPKPMEAYGQNQGLILYRTKLVGHKSGRLTITEPHDYALVFLNRKFVDTVWRDGGKWTVNLPKTSVAEPLLEILVEGMGHINFAQYMIDRKGITDRVTLNGMTLMNWETFLLPMDGAFIQKAARPDRGIDSRPGTIFKGIFNLDITADTYIDMSGYSKGMLYINGHNLGRYWNIGPQQRLYCPAGFLKKGDNEIIIFDLHESEGKPVSGKKTMAG